jgi:pimeloyl-ACP methyl ester carboxylesterase
MEGQDCRMVETASALPLVFFPGAGGRVGSLRPIGERLARRRTVILCEYPGLGGVPADPALETLADLQHHLLATLPPRFDLVTMSMGGVLGLRVALEHPQRIRKLILIATSGGVDVAALGGLDWRDTFRRVQPDVPGWFIEDRTDVTPQLGLIQHPALLIYGDADLIAPVAVGQLLEKSLPDAHMEVIPGATHDLEIDYPDLIASFIEAHLRKP